MKVGIYKDSFEVYNQEPHLRTSIVKEMRVSPGHYLSSLNGPPEEFDGADEGTAVHSVCLEQSTDGYIRRPDDLNLRTNEGKARMKELEATGKIVLHSEVFDSLEQRLDTFVSSQMAMSLYNNAEIEKSHYVKDPTTGLFLKARPDILKPGIIADFKTTGNMQKFEKDIWNLGYFIQVGFYSLVAEISTGTEFESFYFIAQEKKAPYGVQVFSMEREAVAFSKDKARELLHRIAACMEVNDFPIYSDSLKSVRIPTWVLSNELFNEEAV